MKQILAFAGALAVACAAQAFESEGNEPKGRRWQGRQAQRARRNLRGSSEP